MIIPPSNIITHQDRHWIYYAGSNERHGSARTEYGIGGATLRLDGFVALVAGDKPGSLLTKPFELAGDQLEINAAASRGSIQVEIVDSASQPLNGYVSELIQTDGLRLVPDWKAAKDLSKLKGQIVQLRFTLENAKLYAFQVR